MAAVTQPASQQMGLPFSFERERREGERERGRKYHLYSVSCWVTMNMYEVFYIPLVSHD